MIVIYFVVSAQMHFDWSFEKPPDFDTSSLWSGSLAPTVGPNPHERCYDSNLDSRLHQVYHSFSVHFSV